MKDIKIKESVDSTQIAKDSRRGKKSGNPKRRGSVSTRDGMNKPYLKGPNDIEWRTSDDVATKLAANLPFGLPAGSLDEVTTATGNTSAVIGTSQPGIMVVDCKLTLGASSSYNSPINLAARKSYSFIRHANSGSKNYEANDLALYYGACGQVLALLGYLQRIYNTITMFSMTNRYTPRAIIESQGLVYDDLKQHQAELAWLIAWTGRAIGSLALPKFSYFDACYEAFQYVFKDNESPKEQFYLLHPTGFFKFDPTADPNGGSLVFETPSYVGDFGKYSWLYNYVHLLMDVLLGDEDIGVMSGDILKAYGDQGLYVPKAMGDYDVIKHSPEMLQQIHNCSILDPSVLSLDKYVQNPGVSNAAPYLVHSFTQGDAFTLGNTSTFLNGDFIDAFSAVPDAKEVVNCTVLKAGVWGVDADKKADPDKVSFDLILPVGISVWTALHDPATGKFNTYATQLGYVYPCGNYKVSIMSNSQIIALSTNFDWHPLMKFYTNSTTESWRLLTHKVFLVGDLQNARFFSGHIFDRIHENSMLNLFNYMGSNFSNAK